MLFGMFWVKAVSFARSISLIQMLHRLYQLVQVVMLLLGLMSLETVERVEIALQSLRMQMTQQFWLMNLLKREER
jgi:hypothetical protein